MSVSKEFIDAVSNKNIRRVRIMLKNIMVVDPSFKEFDELYKYAKSNLDSLTEEYDNKPFNNNKSQWNKEYLANEQVQLMDNFCNKRIEHLRKVCAAIYINNSLDSDKTHNISSGARTGRVKTKESESRTSKGIHQRDSITGRREIGCREVKKDEENSIDTVGAALSIGGIAVVGTGIVMGEVVIVGAGVVLAGTGMVKMIKANKGDK